MQRRHTTRTLLVAVLALTAIAQQTRPPITSYIDATWNDLTRTTASLAEAAVDPKFLAPADGRWPVFLPPGENRFRTETQLQRAMPPAAWSRIALRPLPRNASNQPGLLYLPNAYVVPGGRFNEMYGWDSYFILLGLLHDGRVDLARGMVDNFLYEIRHYGKILNANRTYYLTRSQPPFLTSMVLEVYRATHDQAWLASTLPAIEQTYRYWTTGPHLTSTGLSRYFDSGEGPAIEVLASEKDAQGRSHYEAVQAYLRDHDVLDYDVSQFYDRRRDRLTPLFYKADRSMRESGFDPSNRFGPFNLDVIHYNPICLNSLLYRMEEQTAEILTILGRTSQVERWRNRADRRATLMHRLLWDEATGLFADYQFEAKQRRHYPFLTTFYPLWVGLATEQEAERVMAHLDLFERDGGLQTSTNTSGSQWDAPYGWAPLQLIAVEAMRRYGYHEAADRISRKFLSLVEEAYQRTGLIVEKYNVVDRDTATDLLRFGYRSNEPGFGWTNAVYLRLSDGLQPRSEPRQPTVATLPKRAFRR